MDASADQLGSDAEPSPFGACPRQIGAEEERNARDRCAGWGGEKEAIAFAARLTSVAGGSPIHLFT
jgi:hypothetical protein